MTPEEIVAAAVAKLGVPYELIPIDPAFADTAAFCEKYGYPVERSCNTIIVASKKEPKKFVACVVLAHTRLDVNKRVTKLMGVSKASFASAEEMVALTGMQVAVMAPAISRPAPFAYHTSAGKSCPLDGVTPTMNGALASFSTSTIEVVTCNRPARTLDSTMFYSPVTVFRSSIEFSAGILLPSLS